MSKGLDADKKKEKVIEVAKSKLLRALFAIQKKTMEREEEHQYELERRYTPKRLLSPEELEKFSNGNFRDIEQCYVLVSSANGKEETIRLRKTSPESEGRLLRIAYKAKTEQNPVARDEYQIRFPESDEKAQEFEKLWRQHKWKTLTKRRFYIPHTLPNESTCEIHYDVHSGGRLDGFVRIEVEFANDEDEKLVREWKGERRVLPDWIGDDVTNIPRYGSKALCRDGNPERIEKGSP